MNIENRVELIELYDLYFELLTDKQKQYFEEYYFDDLSIGEIASNHEISRNAVHDQIKKVIKNLEDYESKIGLLKKITLFSPILEDFFMNFKPSFTEDTPIRRP